MSITRRNFLAGTGTVAAAALAKDHVEAAPVAQAAQTAPALKFRLGIVTYNIAASWDLPTLLRVGRNVGMSPVELRTTHKHGVEPGLSQAARKEVRRRFADAGVDIWGCGTVCEFHDPSRKVVERNIETCRSFIQLVADLGGRGVKVRPNNLPANAPLATTLEQIGPGPRTSRRPTAAAGI